MVKLCREILGGIVRGVEIGREIERELERVGGDSNARHRQ